MVVVSLIAPALNPVRGGHEAPDDRNALAIPPPPHRGDVAGRHRPDLLALHVAHDADAPPRDRPARRRTTARRRSGAASAGDGAAARSRRVSGRCSTGATARASARGAVARGALERVADDLNGRPTDFARFAKTRGDAGALRSATSSSCACPARGTGPCASSPSGHRLPARDARRASRSRADRVLRVDAAARSGSRIEAWARSGDRLSHLLYRHLRMAKEVQLHMWVSFLEGVVRLARRPH